jgi:hypothetical protein
MPKNTKTMKTTKKSTANTTKKSNTKKTTNYNRKAGDGEPVVKPSSQKPTVIETQEEPIQKELQDQNEPIAEAQSKPPSFPIAEPLPQKRLSSINKIRDFEPEGEREREPVYASIPDGEGEREKEPEYAPIPYGKQEQEFEVAEEPIENEVEQEQDTVSEQPRKSRLLLFFSIMITFGAIGLLATGLYILIRRPKYTNTLAANITAASCEPGTQICTVDIKYTVSDIEYTKKDVSVKSLFKVDEKIDILYDSENPNNFVLAQPKWVRSVFGIGLTTLAIIMIIATWWYYNIN